jgi:indolepyruvate ferredoxin oxidoreductase
MSETTQGAQGDSQGVSLSDKYTKTSGHVFMSGVQALVRLPMIIAKRDADKGHNTAGFISGYRGSPLGGYDMQLAGAKAYLDPLNIIVQPAINEDMGATAVWGSQHVTLFEGGRFEGVFGIWYGKSPGVDRTGDVFKHANFAGTAPLGGVLAIAGDDHASKSSTLPNQSDFAFIDAEIPTLAPSTVAEVLEFGVKGIELSRFSGAWVGLKTLADIMDASATVNLSDERFDTQVPIFDCPDDGLHIRAVDTPQAKEIRHRHYRLPAVLAFARVNGFDRTHSLGPKKRLGIVTSGKAYLQVLEALQLLEISDEDSKRIGLNIYKIGLIWPLEPIGARSFCEGHEKILVVEERRDVIEHQLKSALYSLEDTRRPMVLGKRGLSGEPLISDIMDLDTLEVALVIFDLLPDEARGGNRQLRVQSLRARLRLRDELQPISQRKPFFCAGCPHNTSTQLPEGSRATAGIGCHYLATLMPRNTEVCTHMGGEGIPWMGQSPFTDEPHIFANLGDGTYFHSGILAVRQAVAANLNITYKLLYNDVVAMTGGQSVDGQLTPVKVAQQLKSEGVTRIAVVSNEPQKWQGQMPGGTDFFHRDELESVQLSLKAHKGVSVLLYDQACATELRRRRKRKNPPAEKPRLFINKAVCEGCGDCSVKSNCVAVGPEVTELGTKRKIDQSACNLDASCAKGFCPSFVEVEGGQLRKDKPQSIDSLIANLSEPNWPKVSAEPYNILLTGIGGLGVTSLSAIMGMAAHIDGLEVALLDQLGVAQRGGGVDSHIRLSKKGLGVLSPRIALGEVDVLLAADMIQGQGRSSLPLLNAHRSVSFVNSAITATAEFTLNRDAIFDAPRLMRKLTEASKTLYSHDAGDIARRLLGDAVYAHMVLLGAAWQAGQIPISRASIEAAITLNGAAVATNIKAFALGRALSLGRLGAEKVALEREGFDLNGFIERRIQDLTAYQDEHYASGYAESVERVRKAETKLGSGSLKLTEAVARNAFKLMAYKDEYEVARLYNSLEFKASLEAQFDSPKRLSLYLAPPLLSPKDKVTGHPRKIRFGPWIFKAFSLLASLKGLRGTGFDIFGLTEERRRERLMRDEYIALMDRLISRLSLHNHGLAIQIATLPQAVRGFGHVKHKAVELYHKELLDLTHRFEASDTFEPELKKQEALHV